MCRLVLAQAGVKYEDKRVDQEEWAKLKPTIPTGQLPVLEVDGKQLTGSGPIVRFLAKRHGLAGSNDLETAELDGIYDVLIDFMVCFGKAYQEKDEAKKAEIVKEVGQNDIPKYWGIIQKRLQANNSPQGWIYGNEPTYVDFIIYCFCDYLAAMYPDFLERYPEVAKLRTSVEVLPNIAQWLKDRPKTDY